MVDLVRAKDTWEKREPGLPFDMVKAKALRDEQAAAADGGFKWPWQ